MSVLSQEREARGLVAESARARRSNFCVWVRFSLRTNIFFQDFFVVLELLDVQGVDFNFLRKLEILRMQKDNKAEKCNRAVTKK